MACVNFQCGKMLTVDPTLGQCCFISKLKEEVSHESYKVLEMIENYLD